MAVGVPSPMLAVGGELPADDAGWVYEFKWDGLRCLATSADGETRLYSRNGRDITSSFPELVDLASALPDDSIIDGEIVALDETSRPDFGLLQDRMHVDNPGADLVGRVPVTFFAFDLIRYDGHDVGSLAWSHRRRVLDDIDFAGASWRVPPVFGDDGGATLEAARRLRLEGIVAKRSDSTYQAGKRSKSWRKIKLMSRDEFVVVGWTEGSGRRSSSVGALLLGAHDGGELRFVGSVGTGFSDAELAWWYETLTEIEISDDPCNAGPPRPVGRWSDPVLVVEVTYGEWTRDLVLRHPSYSGRRIDRPADEVVMPFTGRPDPST